MRTGTLGAYRIDHLLGTGSSGYVYAATLMQPACGLHTGATVALKVVHPYVTRSEPRLETLQRDAQLAMRINHENVVSILDCDHVVVDGEVVTFVVMEQFVGGPLVDVMQGSGSVSEDRCRHLARGFCRALVAIHATGAVHSRLSPSRVFLTPDDVVKVSGLTALRVWERASPPDEVDALLGAQLYLAPEQLRGAPPDARTDLHALGLMLYELSAGCHPYGQTGGEVFTNLIADSPPRRLREHNPQLSAVFEEVVCQLLAKAPDDRFQSAAEVLTALEDGEDLT